LIVDYNRQSQIFVVVRLGGYKEEQAAISQAAMNIVKQEQMIASQIHEKEIDVGAIENEVARVKIDTMNTSVHNSQLKDRLNDEAEDLNKKDTAVAKLQAEMRRSNDGVESKMNKVDRLDRKYERMVGGVGGVDDEEPLGPLEASIKSLEKDLEEMEGNSKSLQEKWMSNQAKLIKNIEMTEAFEAEKLQKSATLTILKQKRLRLLQDVHTNKASLRDIEGRTKSMHTDMSRLNELIGAHSQMRAKLANEKGLDEIEFSEEIKEIQDKVLKIEAKRVNAQSAKEKLLQQILDTEKEILGWEKKIQLEKETQVALNSSEHAIEIKGMEKEMHRMRHRLEDMNRHQEKMIRDMELAIHKREDIAVKYQHTKQEQRHGPNP
jgi:chromosome segregation ATPase